MVDRASLGRAGEEAAAKALAREGWTLLERNARTPVGELDLVMERKGVFGFVEVKARSPGGPGVPEDAVDARKAARVFAAAESWLVRRGFGRAPRTFLAAAVDMDARGRPAAIRVVPIEG